MSDHYSRDFITVLLWFYCDTQTKLYRHWFTFGAHEVLSLFVHKYIGSCSKVILCCTCLGRQGIVLRIFQKTTLHSVMSG